MDNAEYWEHAKRPTMISLLCYSCVHTARAVRHVASLTLRCGAGSRVNAAYVCTQLAVDDFV